MATTQLLAPAFLAISKHCRHFVGFRRTESGGLVIFINRNSWLCSMEFPGPGSQENLYTQDFFIPNEYLSTNPEVAPVTTAEGDVVFCLHGELVCIRNGMVFQESTVFD
jgi:hypothetical protein